MSKQKKSNTTSAAPAENTTQNILERNGIDIKVVDFLSKTKFYVILTIVLVVLAILASFVGIDTAIEFNGGTILSYTYTGDTMDLDEVQDEVESIVDADVILQTGETIEADEEDVQNTLSITLSTDEGLSEDTQASVTSALETLYPDSEVELANASNVESSITDAHFTWRYIIAAVLGLAIAFIYIGLRFKHVHGWTMATCMVLGSLTTLVVTYGATVLCGFELDYTFLGVLLVMLVYSVNDTVVVFERIRENHRTLPTIPLEDLVNVSNSQTLRRSIQTAAITEAMLLILTVAGLIGDASSLLSFTIPLMIGVLMQTYTSLCFVPAVWVAWLKKRGITEIEPLKKKQPKATVQV